MQHVRKIYVPARAQLPDSSGFLIKGQYQVRGGKKRKETQRRYERTTAEEGNIRRQSSLIYYRVVTGWNALYEKVIM